MKSDRRWHLIQYKFQEHKIVETFELFRKHNIEPILIKGWAAARNYPAPYERVFLDTDIAVAPADYEKALEIVERAGERNLSIDLHNGLRHLDAVEWDDLFDNARLIELDGVGVRILRPEDHLRVLCVHWLNDGGANRERLWDIFYAVENRPSDFDWGRCLGAVDEKRRRWTICAVGLAHKYLGLELEDTPIAAEAELLPVWVCEAVEKEWAEERKLLPLQNCWSEPKEFFRQLKKRFPPNPIQATIETGGEFNDAPRIFYQLKDIFIRIKPSMRRFAKGFYGGRGS